MLEILHKHLLTKSMKTMMYRAVFLLFTAPWCVGRMRHSRNQRSCYDDIVELTEEDRLIHKKLKQYEYRGTLSRPVEKFTDIMKIEFGLQLIQIIDLDEKEQVLTLNVWVDHKWHDRYLSWNVSEYKGVTELHLPSSKIWTPDIKLYNYADKRITEYRDALIIVQHTGDISWLPQAVFRSQCNIDVATFPFDKQNCTLKFGSWTYGGNQLDLQFKNGQANFSLADYTESNVWEIKDSPAVRHEMNYVCCDYAFIDLTFTLVIRRRATFYANILILPCVLLTSLTLVLFWIPPESPAKMMLGMSIFMAFFVLMLLFEANLPPAAVRVPILGTYYCLNMVLITLSSFLNVFVVNMTFFGARAPVPYALKRIMFTWVARMLCMENLVLPFMNEGEMACASKPHFMGVNSDNKWSNDWRGSNECLLTVQKDITDNHTQLAQLHSKVAEIRNFLKLYKERLEEKDRKEKVTREWKALALVFDRIFFIIYFTTIVVSLSIVIVFIFSN
ncbi:neuronal acetylcholine receptor subunit alpha-10-like isoform X1 [Mytilus edulis]|uniref:neuronal acetylcholine receptor subunit alpha-10-like isoform X1 n=2 Tax=Mytilus edulis TaxID=6550 RepID=UPI0039EE3080